MNLNKEQSLVIETEMPILNIAGPGSGKTKTMIEKILKLVKTKDDLENMLIVTFTNNATNEIINRIETSLNVSIDTREANIGTFHAQFFKMINKEYRELNIFGFQNRSISIIQPGDDVNIFETFLKEEYANEFMGLKVKEMKELIEEKFAGNTMTDLYYLVTKPINLGPISFKAIIENIEGKIQNKVDPIDFQSLKNITKKFYTLKQNNNLMSFSDILLYTYLLLEYNEKIRTKFQNKFKYILIDEFQDTNPIQFKILKHLFRNDNYYVVGDPYQSIYKFLGADINNIVDMSLDGKNNVIQLITNYRSTANIVALTNDITTLFTQQVPNFQPCVSGNTTLKNELIQVKEYIYQEEEIVKDIKRKIAAGIPEEEITIIARTNYETAHLEKKLLENRIFYQKLSGKGFYELKEVEAHLALLKFMIDTSDIFAFQKISVYYPKLGKGSIDKLSKQFMIDMQASNTENFNINSYIKKNFQKNKKLNEFIAIFENTNIDYEVFKTISNTIGIKEELQKKAATSAKKKEIELNLKTLFAEVKKVLDRGNVEEVREFLETTSLNSKKDKDKDKKFVNVTTAHSAKGLEWNTVYVLNAKSGMFPSEKSLQKKDELEEEKRLFYVAISRAKQNLMILSPDDVNNFIGVFKNKDYIYYYKGNNTFVKNVFY